MKNIWIIDHYSSEPQYGGISRQYDFAMELAKRDYNVVVLASSFSHFTHSYISNEPIMYSDVNEKVHYVYIKTTEYQSNGGRKRAKGMFDFFYGVKRYESSIAQRYGRPDVVEGCSVHPLAWSAAYWVSRKYKVRFCAEIRDLWPKFWIDAGIKKKYDPMCLFFGAIEKRAFKHADRIIYSMSRGDKYICDERGVCREKTYLIGQPMDCDRFDENSKKFNMVPQNIRDFMEDSFVCTFAGYFIMYEGVFVMLEAAKILLEKGLPIKMVLVGSGEAREEMLDYVKTNKLENVMIGERISKEAIPALLSQSDICMAHLEIKDHKEACQYGTSKNKINEYLYSGACTLYGFMHKDEFVGKSGGGFIFEPYNAKSLAEYIEYIYNMPENERHTIGEKGRKYIRENHSADALTDKLEEAFFGN